MYLLQKMTPAGGMDPVQQKMMSFTMPIFLGVISWSLSAGLCVYWVLGNVIGIVQQMVVNRTKFGREMREHMEKQARRKRKGNEVRRGSTRINGMNWKPPRRRVQDRSRNLGVLGVSAVSTGFSESVRGGN